MTKENEVIDIAIGAIVAQLGRLKGKWERTSFYNDTPVCSECHLEGRWDWDFCPYCGAYMRGEKRVDD